MYGSIRNYDTDSIVRTYLKLFVGIIVFSFILSIGMCTGFIIYTSQNMFLECYDKNMSHNFITLSEYVIIDSSVGLFISVFILAICTYLIYEVGQNNMIEILGASIAFSIFLVLYVIYNIIMIVIGIVLLAYQFEHCSEENSPIPIFVIISIVLKALVLTGGFRGGKI